MRYESFAPKAEPVSGTQLKGGWNGMGAAPPILVADGDRATRREIARLLQRVGHEPIEASTGPEVLELALRLRPPLVILEVNLEEISGYEVCRELRDAFGGEISIIFLSGHRTTSSDRVAGLLVGADDYIVKPFDPDELLARARAALRSDVENSNSAKDASPSVGASLTVREREVLRLLSQGSSQPEIAAALVISPKTVGGHIQRVLTKLGVHSRAHAVAVAHREGLVDVEAHGLPAA
jgi:two-component system nitrate/nitrite response regulator NarL